MSKQPQQFNGIFISVHGITVVRLNNHTWFITSSDKYNYTEWPKLKRNKIPILFVINCHHSKVNVTVNIIYSILISVSRPIVR